jgi:hypothetical protein
MDQRWGEIDVFDIVRFDKVHVWHIANGRYPGVEGEDSVAELVSVMKVQLACDGREEQHTWRCHREAAFVPIAQRLRAAGLALRLARRRAVHLLQPFRYAAARHRESANVGRAFLSRLLLSSSGSSRRCTLRTRPAARGL